MNFYADVVDEPLVIARRKFREPVEVIGRPVHGRLLFTTHDVHIHHCSFYSDGEPLLFIQGVYGARIEYNWFGHPKHA